MWFWLLMQLKITKIFQTKNCLYIKESIKVKKRFAGKKKIMTLM